MNQQRQYINEDWLFSREKYRATGFLFGDPEKNTSGALLNRPKPNGQKYNWTDALQGMLEHEDVNPKLKKRIIEARARAHNDVPRSKLADNITILSQIDKQIYENLRRKDKLSDIPPNAWKNMKADGWEQIIETLRFPVDVAGVTSSALFGSDWLAKQVPWPENWWTMSEEERAEKFPAYMGLYELTKEVVTSPTAIGETPVGRREKFPAITGIMDFFGPKLKLWTEEGRQNLIQYIGDNPIQFLGDASLLASPVAFTKFGKAISLSQAKLGKAVRGAQKAAPGVNVEKLVDTARAAGGHLLENASLDVAEWFIKESAAIAPKLAKMGLTPISYVGKRVVGGMIFRQPMVSVNTLLSEYNPTIDAILKGEIPVEGTVAMLLKNIDEVWQQRKKQWELDRSELGTQKQLEDLDQRFQRGDINPQDFRTEQQRLTSRSLVDAQGNPRNLGFILEDMLDLAKETLGGKLSTDPTQGGLGIPIETKQMQIGDASPIIDQYGKEIGGVTRVEQIKVDPFEEKGLSDYDRSQLEKYVKELESTRNTALRTSDVAKGYYNTTGKSYATFDELFQLKIQLDNIAGFIPESSISRKFYGILKTRLNKLLSDNVDGYDTLQKNYKVRSEVLNESKAFFNVSPEVAREIKGAIKGKRSKLKAQQQLFSKLATFYLGGETQFAQDAIKNLDRYRQPFGEAELSGIGETEALAATMSFKAKGKEPALPQAAGASLYYGRQFAGQIQTLGNLSEAVPSAMIFAPFMGSQRFGQLLLEIGLNKDVARRILGEMKEQGIGPFSEAQAEWRKKLMPAFPKTLKMITSEIGKAVRKTAAAVERTEPLKSAAYIEMRKGLDRLREETLYPSQPGLEEQYIKGVN
jgi:hypothetical protein